MSIFEDAIRVLDQQGVADVLLPFFLVFCLVYIVLQQVQLFGNTGESKKVNIVIGFVVAMAVVFGHVLRPGSSWDVVPIINGALPWVGLLLIAILCLALVVGLATGKGLKYNSNSAQGIIMLLAVVAIALIFTNASDAYWMPYWLQNLFRNPAILNTIIAIAVFVLVIGFITGGDKPAGDNSKKGFAKLLEDLGSYGGGGGESGGKK